MSVNILVFGTGKYLNKLEAYFKESVHIVAYIDNDLEKENIFLKFKYPDITGAIGAYVIRPQKIKEFKYDFVVIASQYCDEIYNQLIEIGVDGKIILKTWNLNLAMISDYTYKINKFKETKNVEVLITGLSYTYNGLDENKLLKNAYDFSNSSQDIYYDYKTIKYLTDNYPKKMEFVKYMIIGLSYYSFEYDLSLSAQVKNRVINYYNILRDTHHYCVIENHITEFNTNKSIADKLFIKNIKGHYEFNTDRVILSNNFNKVNQGREQAEKECGKKVSINS